jgi:hypothetical protein
MIQRAKPNERADVKVPIKKFTTKRNEGAEDKTNVGMCCRGHRSRLGPVRSHGLPLSLLLTTTRLHTMSRLAYYPIPATHRLGSFTLNARPSTFPCSPTPLITPQTAKRWSGTLGIWGVGAGTALVFVRARQFLLYSALAQRTFLILVAFCDTKGEKHRASQGASGASPSLAFSMREASPDCIPRHSSATTTKTTLRLRTNPFKFPLP